MQITDIPTEVFNRILAELIDQGWKKTVEYAGMDAWIDYGKVVLRYKGQSLVLEWDNWAEGSIEGPEDQIQGIKEQYALP